MHKDCIANLISDTKLEVANEMSAATVQVFKIWYKTAFTLFQSTRKHKTEFTYSGFAPLTWTAISRIRCIACSIYAKN